MVEKNLPKEWSEAKIRRIITHYEKQTEIDTMIEDAATAKASDKVRGQQRQR